MREYRRMQGNPSINKWHWRSDCHKWPEVGYETRYATVVRQLLCSRCGDLDRQDRNTESKKGD